MQFSSTAPRKYMHLVKNLPQNNELSLIVNDICGELALLPEKEIELSQKSGSSVMQVSSLMDKMSENAKGRDILSRIDAISGRISSAMSQAFDIILDDLSPRVSALMRRIDLISKEETEKLHRYMSTSNGRTTPLGKKLYFLDIPRLYDEQHSEAVDIAKRLCKKYHYNVEYLNDSNIHGLISRITGVSDVPDVTREMLDAILKDVVVTIQSDNENTVVTTNDPNAVDVDGATKHVHVDDEQSETITDSDESVTEESPEEEGAVDTDDDIDGNVNVSVSSNDKNSNVNVTINGEQVSVTDEEEPNPDEEKETAELCLGIIMACFTENGFSALKSKLFKAQGYVTSSNLVNAMRFTKKNITNAIVKAAENYVTPVQYRMLRSNLEIVNELQQAGVMYLDISMIKFSNTLILGENLINMHLYKKAKSEGIDIDALIRNYLRANHNSNPNDLLYPYLQHKPIHNGVLYNDVLASSLAIEEKLAKARESARYNYTTLVKEARQSAFRKTASAFVQHMADYTNPHDKTKFLMTNTKLLINMANGKSDGNYEDIFYRWIINTWYHGTLVEKIYNQLKDRISYRSATGTVNDEEMKLIKAETVANLTVNFMFDNFIRA